MFDEKKFNKAKFVPRSEKIAVHELKEYFDGEPEWEVKGLSGEEMHRVKESASRDGNIAAAISVLCGSVGEKSQAFKELFAYGDGITEEHTKRIELLVSGTVYPAVDRQTVVRIGKAFPGTLTLLTDKILELTGMGHVPGKLKGSGKTTESEKA